MKKYYNLKGFENLYLEDSFVLSISETKDTITFILDLVLNEEHPFYSEPNDNEKYCYKKGRIIFSNCQSIEWINKHLKKFIDKNKETDLGNIDSFTKNQNKITLIGDWGEVEIITDNIDIIYI